MLPRPRALLMDFGGVLADAPPQRAAKPELVLRLYNLVDGALTPGEIQRALAAGETAYAKWRDEDHPDELAQQEVWDRFVIADWPRGAQVKVRTAIAALTYEWAWRDQWALRPGITALLAGTNLPVAVVSNTLCGAAHRALLAKNDIGHRFAAQIYSDEAGVRKPNPQMIWYATDALGIAPADCWYVGDSHRRDVVCGRRAEVGATILFRSSRTAREEPEPVPDAAVNDGFELLELLREAGQDDPL